MKKAILVLFLSMILGAPAIGAAKRHVRHVAPHHAHLVKHPKTVNAKVVIPPSALKKRPARHKSR